MIQYRLNALLCLLMLFFIQISYGQNGIFEKVKQNYPQINSANIYSPLVEVSEGSIDNQVPQNTLNKKQVFKIDQNIHQKIRTNKSEFIRVSVPIQGQNTELLLFKADLFTYDFKIVNATDPKTPLNPDLGTHFWGIVKNEPGSLVSLSFFDGEITGLIGVGNQQFSIGKVKDSAYHVLFEDDDFNHELDFSCSSIPVDQGKENVDDNSHKSAAVSCVGIHLEVDYSLYQSASGNTATITNYVNGLFSQVAILYANESIAVSISYLNIWNTPSPYNAGTELDDLTNQGYGQTFGNLVHLLHTNGGGGVAYVDVICNNTFNTGVSNVFLSYNNVPTYSWDVEVVTHELGHNLGSPHTHACAWNGNNTAIDGCGPASGNDEGCDPGLPASGTIMSYCHLVPGVGIDFNLGFGQQPGDLIRSRVAAANCASACNLVCPSAIISPLTVSDDVCAIKGSYTLPSNFTAVTLDDDAIATYTWSADNYIINGGNAITGNSVTLINPTGCTPETQTLYLNVGCTTDNTLRLNAGTLTLNVYPDPAQLTATDLVTVSGENTCNEPTLSINCPGVTITPDPANPSFPVANGSGTANYTVTYGPTAGAPDCCSVDLSDELITNGDFEAGTTGWTELEEVPAGTPNPSPFGIIGVSNGALNGTTDAWFGGWGGTSFLSISQNITIPETCGTAELVFDYAMSCVNGGATLSIAVNGVVLGSLACADGTGGTIAPFDLIAAGAPTGNVTFTIIGEEDGTGTDEPDIYVDNVSIVTSGCTTQAACDFPVTATYDCVQSCAGVDLSIFFDGFPAQTSWDLTDVSGAVLASGGSYGSQPSNSTLDMNGIACLADGCYTLNFRDALNNGMCPFRANAAATGTFITAGTTIIAGSIVASFGLGVTPGLCGNYTLLDANGSPLVSGGGSFGALESQTFCLSGGVAAKTSNLENSISRDLLSIYPTLATGFINLEFGFDNETDVEIAVYDINGKIVQQYNNLVVKSWESMQLNIADLNRGSYFIRMNSVEGSTTKRFIKN